MSAGIRGNIAQPAEKLAIIGDPGDVFRNPQQAEYMRTLTRGISDALRGTVSSDTASTSILLLSPNGQAWRLMVDDAGALFTVNARAAT